MVQTLTETALLQGIRTHDRQALEQLYRQYFPVVRSFVLQHGGRADDAGDVFQDGVIALWDNILKGKYESRPDKGIGAYLVQICRFRWLERTKSAAFRNTSGWNPDWEKADDNNQLDGLMQREEIALATQLMSRLGDRCRDILTGFYYYRQSLQEIAVQQQITPDSAKNEKYRCMQRLKKLYVDHLNKA